MFVYYQHFERENYFNYHQNMKLKINVAIKISIHEI